MEWMVMPLKRYAEFGGRSRRKEYWMFALFLMLIYVAFAILLGVLGASAFMSMGAGSSGGAAALGGGALIMGGVFALFGLAVLVPSLAVAVRRLHDTGRSGWFLLAPLAGYPIQIIGAVMNSGAVAILGSLVSLGFGVMLLVFYCLDGTPGPNQYGEDPKGRGDVVPAY